MAAFPNLEKLKTLTEQLNDKEKKLKDEYSTFFNTALDLLCIIDDNILIKANKAWADTLGWDLSELINNSILEYVHPQDRAKTQEMLQTIVDGEKSLYFRNRVRCKDGSYKILCWTGVQGLNKSVNAVVRDFSAMMDRIAE